MSDLMRYRGMDDNKPFKRGELLRVRIDAKRSFMSGRGLMIDATRQSDGAMFVVEYGTLQQAIYDWELA